MPLLLGDSEQMHIEPFAVAKNVAAANAFSDEAKPLVQLENGCVETENFAVEFFQIQCAEGKVEGSKLQPSTDADSLGVGTQVESPVSAAVRARNCPEDRCADQFVPFEDAEESKLRIVLGSLGPGKMLGLADDLRRIHVRSHGWLISNVAHARHVIIRKIDERPKSQPFCDAG